MSSLSKTHEELLEEVTSLQLQVKELSGEGNSEASKNQGSVNNGLLLNILESSTSISIISTDVERNIVYWNVGAENMFGYRAREMVGKEKIDLLYPDDENTTQKTISKAREFILRNRKGTSCEIKEKTKDGRNLWIRMTLTPRLNANGDVVGILGIGEDITERKRAEQDLRETLSCLRKALGGVIDAMALTVETKDAYTAGHQKRVADLARTLAERMNLSRERIEGVRMAGVIHDLGKISIPGEILSKPCRLSDIEFSMIQMHPQTAYDILQTIDFPWPVANIVLQHHERIDGSGYPNQLTGNHILIESKILAVADVVEAMMSHRPYRPALGIEMALDEIKNGRGTVYDKDVVDACLGMFEEKGVAMKE